jgi:hypothetical protein
VIARTAQPALARYLVPLLLGLLYVPLLLGLVEVPLLLGLL